MKCSRPKYLSGFNPTYQSLIPMHLLNEYCCRTASQLNYNLSPMRIIKAGNVKYASILLFAMKVQAMSDVSWCAWIRMVGRLLEV